MDVAGCWMIQLLVTLALLHGCQNFGIFVRHDQLLNFNYNALVFFYVSYMISNQILAANFSAQLMAFSAVLN